MSTIPEIDGITLPKEEVAEIIRKHLYRAAYRRAHARLNNLRGPARKHTCFTCGNQAAQWARLWRLGREVLDLSTYVPMCHDCHTDYDRDIYTVKASNRPRSVFPRIPIGWSPCGFNCSCSCHERYKGDEDAT